MTASDHPSIHLPTSHHHNLRFASFDMLRRLSLTSLLLLFNSSLVQIQVALLLSFLGIVVTQEAAPHWTPVADSVQYGACGGRVRGAAFASH